jgi:hypothetical protein
LERLPHDATCNSCLDSIMKAPRESWVRRLCPEHRTQHGSAAVRPTSLLQLPPPVLALLHISHNSLISALCYALSMIIPYFLCLRSCRVAFFLMVLSSLLAFK